MSALGDPPPKRVKSGHLLSEKARKSRQMGFRDKTAYAWGLAIIEILHYRGLPITDPAH